MTAIMPVADDRYHRRAGPRSLGGAVSDHVAGWRALVDAPSPAGAVRSHLASFLVRADEDRHVLDQVMRRFRAVRLASHDLELEFAAVGAPVVVHASPPYGGPTDGIAPTVQDVIRVHNGFGWVEYGGGATAFYGYDSDGRPSSGGFESQYLEECDEDCGFLTAVRAAGLEFDDVAAPFDAGQDWILWHPAERNAHGEPMPYYFSHEGGDPERIDETYDLALGQVLLRWLAEAVGEE
jgi:hypothetical protein